MEIPNQETIDSMFKNNVLLMIGELKKEKQLKVNEISDLRFAYYSARKNILIDRTKEILHSDEFEIFDENCTNTNTIRIKYQDYYIDMNIDELSNYNDQGVQYEHKLCIDLPYIHRNELSKSVNVYKLAVKIGDSILGGLFKEQLENINNMRFQLDKDILNININEISVLLNKLNDRLTKIKFEEAFQEGNTFIFDFKEYIMYKRGGGSSRRRRYFSNNSVAAKILHIVRITPTMVEFKVKQNESDSDWFKYEKTHIRTKKTESDLEKETYTEETDLIKKKKEYIFEFIVNNKMKLEKVQGRKLKLKNILESEIND